MTEPRRSSRRSASGGRPGIAGYVACIGAALLVACGEGDGSAPRAFSLNTAIPIGPLTLTVAEAKRQPPGELDAFEAVLEFRGQELPPGQERVIVLVRSGGVDTAGKAQQFLGVFDQRFTLVDQAGTRYPRVAIMTTLTYRFLRTTPPAELTDLVAYASLPLNTREALVHDLEFYRTSKEAFRDPRPRREGGGYGNPFVEGGGEGEIVQSWVVVFSAPRGSQGFALLIDNPEPRQGQTRLARVPLGL